MSIFLKGNERTLKSAISPWKRLYKEVNFIEEKNIFKSLLQLLTSPRSDLIIYLHSSIVLRNNSTFSILLAQDQDVVGPQIQTNKIKPKVQISCNNYDISLEFPPKKPNNPDSKRVYKVCDSFFPINAYRNF